MAVSKFIGAIHAPKKSYRVLKNTIAYILNPQKTENGMYTGAWNCRCDHALEDMQETQKFYGKQPLKKSDRIAYHMCISWKAESDITAETALKICEEFCQEYLKNYEVVFGVHTDQPHIHAHICFNSVSTKDGYKYQYKDGDWEKTIRPMVDRICQRYGMPTLDEEIAMLPDRETEYEKIARKAAQRRKRNTAEYQQTGKRHHYYNEKTEFYNRQDHIRVDIDHAVLESGNWKEFLQHMIEKGYEVKTGTYFAVRGAGMEKFRRTYRLGEEYSEENIKRRILAKQELSKMECLLPEDFSEEYLLSSKLPQIGRICLTEQSRKHYAMQYRQGLLKPGQNRAYYAVRQALKEKERREMVQKFLENKGICDTASAKKVLADYPKQLEKMKIHVLEMIL